MERLRDLAEQYFNPVSFEDTEGRTQYKKSTIGESLLNIDSSSEQVDFVIIGVEFDKNTGNEGCGESPDEIRESLYELYNPSNKAGIVDLGNLKMGPSSSDVYFALRLVVSELIDMQVKPIILGGGNDLVFGQFLGHETVTDSINIVSIDSRFDLGLSESITADNYLSKIITDYGQKLFNFSILGVQKYLVSQADFDLMNKLFFDVFRLGDTRHNIHLTEPVFRDSDMVYIDMTSIRNADCPGEANPSPNGFYAEEVCQLAWYAGNSQKVKSFGIYETSNAGGQSVNARLSAQVAWHFMDGAIAQKLKHLTTNFNNCSKYYVDVDVLEHKLTFMHDDLLDLWWIELPYQDADSQENIIIACSKDDYVKATKGEVPDRLWRMYQKIS